VTGEHPLRLLQTNGRSASTRAWRGSGEGNLSGGELQGRSLIQKSFRIDGGDRDPAIWKVAGDKSGFGPRRALWFPLRGEPEEFRGGDGKKRQRFQRSGGR